MATGTTNNDREFLFRLQTEIIDGGSDVLRNIFDQKLQNTPLNVCLATEKTSINRLRAQKTITKTQYNLLYPPGGQFPNSANFDITLIICLLRNINSLGLNPTFSWNTPPQPSDTSLEADLCRLKGFRNEIAHISSTTGFQQASYLTKWTEIEQVLLRLNSAVPKPVPDLKKTLDSYKHSPLEPAAEKKIQADIENWRKMEKALEVEMELMKEEIKSRHRDLNKTIEEGFKKVTDDVGEVKGSVEKMTEHVRKIEEQVKVKEGTELIKEDVKGLQKEVITRFEKVNIDVVEIKNNVEIINTNIRKLEEVKVKEAKEPNIQASRQREEEGKLRSIFRCCLPSSPEKGSSPEKDLQDNMISFYRDKHCTISLSPLIEEVTPLLKFYVMPDINSLEVQRSRSGVREEKTVVTPLRNVFYNNDKMYHKIYLTADAGLGKTALSKRLTLAWCHANKPHKNEAQYFSLEEIKAVKEFRFVFLLLLRESSSKCEIDDLIWNQIISRLGHDYIREDLVNILCNERCLVILDGLDEWSHPSNSCEQELKFIPHQKFRERTAVLTTTRPWKLSVIGLNSSQIGQKLELMGLNKKTAIRLKKSVISHLFHEENEQKLDKHVTEFTKAVEEKQISDLEAIPLLLMYMLFLWCNKIELGQSHCDLYSQITELLLSRTVQIYTEVLQTVGARKGNIPQCFSGDGKKHCRKFYTLLTALGKLAYQTLLEMGEENMLVFDRSVAEQYLNKNDLNVCLKTGLITQNKVHGTLLEHKTKVSFAHKTVQEFFAALYMHSTVSETVLSKCKCVKDILEMSKLIKFSCGMNVNVPSLISREMMKIINEDEITRKYRSSLKSSTSGNNFNHPLKDFQDMCISCCKEIPCENEVSFCFQDVFINGNCQQGQYRKSLQQLTTGNKQNIRSLYIDMERMGDTPYRNVHEIFKYFALNDLTNIKTIHFKSPEYDNCDILPLLTSLQTLEVIQYMGKFAMSHSELTLAYYDISQRHCMRQIGLEGLFCTDHGRDSCTGCLDLSQNSQLNTLTLDYIPVSELNVNMASLEKCRLDSLSNPDLVLHFINCVPAESKLKTFECRSLKSPAAIETMLKTLRSSVHVCLELINLGNRELLTSEMENIVRVELKRVTMTASVLLGIVEVVQQLPQTVTVHIDGCDIKPESELVTVKQKIKTSREHFRVLYDIKSSEWSTFLFEFKTIKQGD